MHIVVIILGVYLQLWLPIGKWGKSVVNLGVNNSSSMYTDKRKQDILILGEGATDGSDDTTITTEV